jgi:hypothetical protein
MSLEQNIAELNTNIKALIAALAAAGTVSTASTGTAAAAADTSAAKTESKPAAAGKGGKAAAAKKDDAPKGPTVEEMQAALGKVKEEQGAAAAKAIISDVAGVAKMAEIPADKVKAVFEAATKALAGDDETGTDDDDI